MIIAKHKKIILLFVALFVFYTIINGTFSIYRETKGDSINLSILDSSGMVTVTFDPNGGTIPSVDATRSVQNGSEVGALPTTMTRTNYNFDGWYTANGVKITSNTIVTGTTVTYFAHWIKIVCKKAVEGTLHQETCSTGGSCLNSMMGYKNGDKITYGTIPGASSPRKGDAYDCDVNDDDVWDPLTERFYYIRSFGGTSQAENSALVHFTSFDINGQMDSGSSRGSYVYNTALLYLPTSSTWDNTALIENNGNVTRFIQKEDIEAACGGLTDNDLVNCQYFLEKSRFQSSSLGRAGIWIEAENNDYHRIHTQSLYNYNSVQATSENTARPVIEIPTNTIEDYHNSQTYTINFDPGDGALDNQNDATRNVQGGAAIGTLPTATYEHHTLLGWFTDPTNGTQITANTQVSGNDTYYAHWVENIVITFNAMGGTVTPASKEIAPGTAIGELPTPVYSENAFAGWYTSNPETLVTTSTTFDTDTQLYAHWDAETYYVFYIPGECKFTSEGITNGTNGNCISTINPTGSNIDYTQAPLSTKKYIDTGIGLYNSTNHDYDYEIHFEIVSYVYSENEPQATFFNTKKEGDYFPGLVVRKTTINNNQIEFASRKSTSENESIILDDTMTKLSVYRTNQKIYYQIDDGEIIFANDLKSYNPTFGLTTWFGGAPTNSSATAARRFFTGTLKNMYIKIKPSTAEYATITFDPNYNGSQTFDDEYIIGEEIGTLPPITRSGYTFIGWFDDPNNGNQITSSTIIEDDDTFYAHWLENITVTFNPGAGTVTPTTKTFAPGSAIGELPTPERTGYTFAGWFTDDGTYQNEVTTATTFNTTTVIYAKWLENITITFNPGTGGTVTPTSKTFTSGSAIGELPTPERTGYTFAGWFTDDGTYQNEVTTATTFNTTTVIYAKWIENITVTFNPGAGTVSPTSKTFTSGTAIGELPTPERTGFIFDGWYTDPTSGDVVTEETVFTNTDSIYAHWIEYVTVTFDPGTGGTVSPTSKTFAPGLTIGELPIPERTGYTFIGWYLDDETYQNEVTASTTFNTTTVIYAKWEESTDITITFDADEGTVTPTSKTFAPGSEIGELPTPEKTGNVFVGWYTDNTWITEVTEETTFDSSTAIIAKWVDTTYVACINATCYTSLQNAVAAVPTTGEKTTIKIIQDISLSDKTTIPNTKWVVLNIGPHTISSNTGTFTLLYNNGKLDLINGTITSSAGYILENAANATLNISDGVTISYTNSGQSEKKVLEMAGGTVNITGGNLSCASKAAVINANGGTLRITGGKIKGNNTTKGQAIYNNGATTTISGTAHLENVSQSGTTNGRAAITNNSGTVNILGGTVISANNAAVSNKGTLVIGEDDGKVNITSPSMQGSTYGLENTSGTVSFYDGVFKGKGATDNAIKTESSVNHGTLTLVHDTETIENVQYTITYLNDPNASYTVTFNKNGGDTVTSETTTLTEEGPIGELPTATKANTEFLGWFTEATGGDRVFATTEVSDDATFYAHYTNNNIVCRSATTLHSSNSTDFGQIPTSTTLSAGDAFDCDVNGDGTYDATNERFYYLTDTSNGKAVLIYSNNTHQGQSGVVPMCKADAVAYGPNFTDGPNTAIGELPTTSEWTNVNLYTEPRTITNEAGTTITSNYMYTGKAARLASLDEIKAATSSSINETVNELATYTFLLENTVSYDDCRSNYWLETTNSSSGAVRINGATSAKSLGHATGSSGVRPVIEVPHSAISVENAINIVEFDTIPDAMRVYFNSVSTWNTGQDDSNYSSFNSSMLANLDNYNCAYYENDNTGSQHGSVFCDQPKQYDTGVTGEVNVYEYDESTDTISNTQATYVSNNNGKLYNFIPGKTYYWESASNSSNNGYVRPIGERRLITIPGTTRQTRNVRDLGGLPVDVDGDGTIDGKTKFAKIYRGEKIWGTNRNGVTRAQFEKLGIYNELDLRTQGSEIVASEEDQLANYIPFEILHYKIDYDTFGPNSSYLLNGKSYYDAARDAAIDVMQRIVAGNDDYAMFFHCRIGADRTGTLAYLLEGVLGVPTEYRHQDYELTTFFGLRERTRYYFRKDSTNDEYKFIYLKKAIRHATQNNNEITGEENVIDWFLQGGNSTNNCNSITDLISQFRQKMIDYN